MYDEDVSIELQDKVGESANGNNNIKAPNGSTGQEAGDIKITVIDPEAGTATGTDAVNGKTNTTNGDINNPEATWNKGTEV